MHAPGKEREINSLGPFFFLDNITNPSHPVGGKHCLLSSYVRFIIFGVSLTILCNCAMGKLICI